MMKRGHGIPIIVFFLLCLLPLFAGQITTLRIRKVGRAPNFIALSPDGSKIYSTSFSSNELLEIESLPGDFRARARVTYCQPQSEGFAIGLEFLEPTGRWVVNTPVISGKPLQG